MATFTPTSGNSSYPKPTTIQDAARFLLQVQFNVTSWDELQSVMKMGYAGYLNQEFNRPMPPNGVAWLLSQGYDASSNANYYEQHSFSRAAIWQQLFSSRDGMRKRAALALSEFFVVSKQSLNWGNFGFTSYFDMLSQQAFGNFRELIEGVTLSPVMGYFLNTKGNLKEDPKTNRLPDENFAREIMQLFSIGLYQLNLNGTEKLDAKGQKIETYTQSDVANLCRVFTGYDLDKSVGFTAAWKYNTQTGERMMNRPDYNNMVRPLVLNPSQHSMLSASFLGITIPANTDGKVALKITLDTLFNHPNTAPFFCKQMIQRLVTSNPSPAYVERVARVFNNNGLGIRGDLKAVFSAIWLDDEARNPINALSRSFGKIREPMIRLIQWARHSGTMSAANYWRNMDEVSVLGQTPLTAPSVFNFFRPGYVPPNTALSSKEIPAPEMALVNEVSVAQYINAMQKFITDGISPDMQPKYTYELSICQDTAWLVTYLNTLLAAGQIPENDTAAMVYALNQQPVWVTSTTADKWSRVAQTMLMVMAHPAYLVQK